MSAKATTIVASHLMLGFVIVIIIILSKQVTKTQYFINQFIYLSIYESLEYDHLSCFLISKYILGMMCMAISS